MTSWSLTTLAMQEDTTMIAVSNAAVIDVKSLKRQELANLRRLSGRSGTLADRLLDTPSTGISAAASEDLPPQNAANIAWRSISSNVANKPPMGSAVERITICVDECNAQQLDNVARNLGKLGICGLPAFGAVLIAINENVNSLAPQNVVNIA